MKMEKARCGNEKWENKKVGAPEITFHSPVDLSPTHREIIAFEFVAELMDPGPPCTKWMKSHHM